MIARILWALSFLLLAGFLLYEAVKYGWVMGVVVIVFLLLPDTALIGAFDRSRPGKLHRHRVPLYNVFHRPWIALALLVIGAALPLPALGSVDDSGKLIALAGVAWLTHICADRAFGYGLRTAEGAIRSVGGTRTPSTCSA